MVANSLRAAIDVEACYRYTLGRQTRQGGFCFYTHAEWGVEEPNAPDTRAALEIVAKLGRSIRNPLQCVAWLRAQQDASGGYSTLIIGDAALKALQRLNAEPERDPRRFLIDCSERLRLAAPDGQRHQGWLSAARRCVELRGLYDIAVTTAVRKAVASALTSLRGSEGGYGAPGANLPETALALTLAVAVGLPAPVECLSYARECEEPPHGFNVRPHASSVNLESQSAGMQILHHFGERPRNPGRVRNYVAACQGTGGGFGRVPGAIPRLDDTLSALEILSLLGDGNN